MIDDRHAVAGVEQLLRLHEVGAVGVHHHEQRAGLCLDEGVAAADEGVLILRQRGKALEDRAGGIVVHVNDDLRLLAALARDAAHARRRADGVEVGVLMAHDKDLTGIGDQLAEGVGHHAGLDLRALFGGLRLAAVELKIEAVAHDDLIAAARERHLDGQARVLEKRLVIVRVLADADGERRGDAVLGDNGAHRVEHAELALEQRIVMLFRQQQQIAVAVVLAQKPLRARHPRADLFVDLREHRRARRLGAGLHQLLVVIEHEHGHDGAVLLALFPELVLLGHVHPIGQREKSARTAAATRMRETAEHAEVPVVDDDRFRALALSLQQPLGGEAGQRILQPVIEQILPHARELEEALVAPQHLLRIGPEDHHGKGGREHGGLARARHIVGHILDVALDALAALLRRAAEIDVGERHHTGLDEAEDRLDPQRHRAEDCGKKKIQPHIRLGQLIDFLTHKVSSPLHRRHKGGTNTDRYYIVAHGRARVQ